jgi:hypothetical protein
MAWMTAVLVWVLVLSGLLQLFWAYALSAIARKTGQGTAMEILAWIPLLQIAPIVAAGGGSALGALLGGIGLVVANVALLGVAAFLGDPIGGLLAFSGLGLTTLLCVVYFGQIAWVTAVERDCSGWVGLLVFVPILNFFVYPYLAFHDGWTRPNPVGLALGALLIVLSSAPSVIAIRSIEAKGAFDPDAVFAFDPADAFELGFASAGHETARGDAASATMDGRIDGTTIRALYRLQERFDALARISADGDRAEALALIQSLRAELESNRGTLDDSTFLELTAHLQDAEARMRAPGSAETGGTRGSATLARITKRQAVLPPPEEAFPVAPPADCPAHTELRTRSGPDAEEEWCEQPAELGGLRHGFYARYRKNGRPESTGEYRNGLRVGVWTRFHPDGSIRAQAEFRDGLQHGWLLSFDESGGRTGAVRFENGARVPSG